METSQGDFCKLAESSEKVIAFPVYIAALFAFEAFIIQIATALAILSDKRTEDRVFGVVKIP